MKPGEMIFVSPWLIQRHTQDSGTGRTSSIRTASPIRPARNRSARAYIPFSAGPRVCLGASFAMQEGMLILAYLARHFRFEPVANHTPKPIARLTLRSENGVRLRVFRRRRRSGSAVRDVARLRRPRRRMPVPPADAIAAVAHRT